MKPSAKSFILSRLYKMLDFSKQQHREYQACGNTTMEFYKEGQIFAWKKAINIVEQEFELWEDEYK